MPLRSRAQGPRGAPRPLRRVQGADAPERGTHGAVLSQWAFDTLREAVDFYARRDTDPGLWYPKAAPGVHKFDDLPAELAGSVNTSEVPYDRTVGGTPALTPEEIDDVVAFLATLDDGYN